MVPGAEAAERLEIVEIGDLRERALDPSLELGEMFITRRQHLRVDQRCS
jgi:hypothetical protein